MTREQHQAELQRLRARLQSDLDAYTELPPEEQWAEFEETLRDFRKMAERVRAPHVWSRLTPEVQHFLAPTLEQVRRVEGLEAREELKLDSGRLVPAYVELCVFTAYVQWLLGQPQPGVPEGPKVQA